MIIPEDAKRLKSQQLRFEIERVLGSDIGESNIKILDNPISLVV